MQQYREGKTAENGRIGRECSTALDAVENLTPRKPEQDCN